jgi:carbamoyl-phosphate synthase large subunit
VDVLLGPEMRSTGEVMGLDKSYDMAFAKSQLGAGMRMPLVGTVFISVKDADKARILPAMRRLVELGFKLVATGGTQRYFEEKGIPSTKINKVLEGRPHVVDAIKNGDIQLVLNTTETRSSQSDSKPIRQTALLQKVPYYTTLPGILAVTKAIAAQKAGTIEVKPLQDYF